MPALTSRDIITDDVARVFSADDHNSDTEFESSSASRKLSQESYETKHSRSRRLSRHSAAASRVCRHSFETVIKKQDRRTTKQFSHGRLSATPSPSPNRSPLTARRRHLSPPRSASPAAEICDDPEKYLISSKPLSTEPTTLLLNQERSTSSGSGSERDRGILDQPVVNASGAFPAESGLEKTNETRESSSLTNGTLGRNVESATKGGDVEITRRSSSSNQTEECISDGKRHFDPLSFGSEEPRLATPKASQPDTPFVKSETRTVQFESNSSSSSSWQNSLSEGLNPFKCVHCVASESERRELFDGFNFETLHTLLHDLSEFIQTPSSISTYAEDDGFAAIIYGKHIRAQSYILDNGKRVWHEDTTWLKVFYGRRLVRTAIPIGIGLVQDSRSPGHPNWQLLIAIVLNRMIVVSGGLLAGGHREDGCLRGIIALQTIREMLRWRNIFRSIAHVVGEAKYSHRRYGTFTVSEDEELCLNGNSVPDIEYLDPTRWISERGLSCGLLAWVNLKVDVIVNARDLLHNIELSDKAILAWCRTTLQFGAGRDVQSAIAFVGVLRYLFVRKYLPAECAAATHLCANEFLDCANGVSELEGCLPELLGVSSTFRRGFDIDTGAITHVSVKRKVQSGRMLKTTSSLEEPANRPRRTWSRQGDKTRTLITGPPSSAGVSFRGLRKAAEGQVVLSAWTDHLDGAEWQVPRTVSQHIDFMKKKAKYRMSVRRGDVTCRRVGKLQWFRKHFDRMSGLQVMGTGITRERGLDPEEFASGGLAISNALGGEYGEEVCLHVLSWLHRGMIRLHSNCTAAAFVPKNSVATDGLTVNQHLSYDVCSKFVFARREHELFWLPGEGLPCFRMKNCPNGKYLLQEQVELPEGVEMCRAEITKDFG